MVLTELYASSHPLCPLPWDSWCSRDAGISNDDSQWRVGAQAVIRCAQAGTTWPPWHNTAPHLTQITENKCSNKFQTTQLLVIQYKSNIHKISQIKEYTNSYV